MLPSPTNYLAEETLQPASVQKMEWVYRAERLDQREGKLCALCIPVRESWCSGIYDFVPGAGVKASISTSQGDCISSVPMPRSVERGWEVFSPVASTPSLPAILCFASGAAVGGHGRNSLVHSLQYNRTPLGTPELPGGAHGRCGGSVQSCFDYEYGEIVAK